MIRSLPATVAIAVGAIVIGAFVAGCSEPATQDTEAQDTEAQDTEAQDAETQDDVAWWRAAGEPPLATEEPRELTHHGHTRVDPWFWLRDREDPRVEEYLEAENRYLEAALAPLADLRSRLEEEMVARVARSVPMVPFDHGEHHYYSRQESEYPVYYRRPLAGGTEQLLLDGAEVCAGSGHCRIELQQPDSAGRVLPWAVDTRGGRLYTVRFLDMESGRMLDDEIVGPVGYALFGSRAFPSVVWAADDATLFYPRQDPQTLRTTEIRRHRLGTEQSDDVVAYREEDETFWTMVDRTLSGRLLVIYSFGPDTTDCLVLEADEPDGEPRRVLPRLAGREVWLQEWNGDLLLRTHEPGTPMRVVRAPSDAFSSDDWLPLHEPGEDVAIERIDVVGRWLVVLERSDALRRLLAVDLQSGERRALAFDEEAYRVIVDLRQDPTGTAIRLQYSSLTTPRTLLAFDLETGERRVVEQLDELPGYDASQYRTWRAEAPARDGASIPITLVARRDLTEAGGNPILLHGYGTYGVTMDPRFDPLRLSLLDRGFVYAIAHVRGGGARGPTWYEGGRGAQKINTFLDFVDSAEYLVESGLADPERLYAMGESAGGALVGVAVNLAPERFHGAVARVPFVDVLTSMLDPTIPLVTGEYGEWGDPREADGYRAMLEWSPYDNVAHQPYPHLLVLTGWNDRQVGYWEPAKWVAKLRATRTDDGLTLLRTKMESGHGGDQATRARVQEQALIQSFLIRLAGRG